jgi:hypothetical protein
MADCSIKGCEKQARNRGLCSAHYERLRLGKSLSGDLQTQHHGLAPIERFNKWWVADDATGCWMWQGKLNKHGYGQFNMGGSRPLLSHRASWVLHNGEIPDNPNSAYKTYYVCHTCDTPACVNPKHLFLGDQQSNMDDKMGKDRHEYGISRGVNHGNAKLTEDLVREIRASEETTLQLHRRLGIARSTLDMVRKRLTWKHVE